MKNSTARNGAVDVYRFVFCMLIAFHHFFSHSTMHELPFATLGVEFFVLISGAFFFQKWERERDLYSPELYCKRYLKSRWIRFFECSFLAFVITFVIRRIVLALLEHTPFSVHTLLSNAAKDLPEILLFGMSGIRDSGFLNLPVWTLSAMLLSEAAILCVITLNRRLFTWIVCPFSLVIGFAFWKQTESANYLHWIGFTNFGTLRVYLLMCLSFYMVLLARKIQENAWLSRSKPWRIALTVVELLSILVVLYMALRYKPTRDLRFLAIALLFLAGAAVLSGKSYSSVLFSDSRFTRWLGEMSLAVYLIHFPIYKVFQFACGTEAPDSFWPLYGLIVLAAAALFLVLLRSLQRAVRSFSRQNTAK